MEIEYKCPYCGQDKYSSNSKKSGKFSDWKTVRTHTIRCKRSTGEYYIDEYYGPIHYTDISQSTIETKYYKVKQSYSQLVRTFSLKGINLEKIKTKYSKQNIIEAIQKYYIENNRLPVRRDFSGDGYPSHTTVLVYFCTWNNAIEAAGFTPKNKQNKSYKDCSKEGIIEAVQRFYKKNNRIPQYRDFSSKNYPNNKTVQKYFGTWNKAIEAAGYPPNIQSGYGVRTVALDGVLYRSKAEAYFCDNYLYQKYTYDVEPKYPEPHNRYYDWYIKELDLYIELDGGCRPAVTDTKININNELNRKLLVVKTKDIYDKSSLLDFL